MTIKWARSVFDWQALNEGYCFRNLPVWPYHALDAGALHPDGGYRTQCGHSLMSSVTRYEQPPGVPCRDCALQLARGSCPRCGAQQQRPETSLELLHTAVTRRQMAARVVELVLALAEETPTLTNAQRGELRGLAARVRPG